MHAIRLSKTDKHAAYVYKKLQDSSSETVKRACLECIRNWKDRPSFIHARNKWSNFSSEVQRMLWLASFEFGDEGKHFRLQVKNAIHNMWSLGIELKDKPSFSGAYVSWVDEAVKK